MSELSGFADVRVVATTVVSAKPRRGFSKHTMIVVNDVPLILLIEWSTYVKTSVCLDVLSKLTKK